MAGGIFSHARRLRWSAPRLQVEREARLRELLAWAAERSPFHAERLRGIDVTHFTEAQLSSLAPMTKDDLMSEFDSIVTDPQLTLDVVEHHVEHSPDSYLCDRFRAVTSSGSSGRRGVFVYDWGEWTTLALMQSRSRLGTVDDASRPSGAATASLFAGDGAHLSKQVRSVLDDPSDPMHHFPMTLPVDELVRGLNAVQPDLLMGYPSALELIVHEAQEGRLQIAPTHVETGGELLMQTTRAAVRELWGVEIDDCWAVVEGAFAFPCRFGTAMHLPDDLVIVEPVDVDGHPVSPGNPAAKIYLTNLYNLTEPLIRFEITDGLTVLDDACPCGSAHRRITNLTGRADNVFEYEHKVKVQPMAFRLEFHDLRHVVEYQVRQTRRGVTIRVVTDQPEGLAQVRDLALHTLQRAGLVDPDVTVEPVAHLERQDSGKLRQFVALSR